MDTKPATKTLTVTQTRDRFGKPLCVVHDLPGEGAEMYPAQMRALAEALTNAAIVAESGAADRGPRTFAHVL